MGLHNLKVVFLGTVGYHPNEWRHTTCLMIPKIGIIFDAGTGFFRTATYARTPTLNILLLHFHPDHVEGLYYLYDMIWKINADRSRERIQKINILTPSEETLRNMFNPTNFPIDLDLMAKVFKFELYIKEMHDGDSFKTDSGSEIITSHTVPHGKTSTLAYAIQHRGNEKIGIIADTTADPQNKELIQKFSELDLLIHECNFRNEYQQIAINSGHSYSKIVAEFAQNCRCKKLALFHLNPLDPAPGSQVSELLPYYEGQVTIPNDRGRVKI